MRQMILLFLIAVTGTMMVSAQGRADQVLSAPATHRACVRAPGIRLQLDGIYALQGLLWFRISINNSSVLDFHALPVRVYIADRRTWRRRARQQVPLAVVVRREKLIVAGDSAVNLCYGVTPRLPGRGQVLVLEYAERSGPRHLALRMSQKELLHAKKLENESRGGVYQRNEQATGAVTGQ